MLKKNFDFFISLF